MSEKEIDLVNQIEQLAQSYKEQISQLEAENIELRQTLAAAHRLLEITGVLDTRGARNFPTLSELKPI